MSSALLTRNSGRFRTKRRAIGLLFAACLCSLVGCSADKGGGVPVSGTVTFNGEPLINGSITFVNQDDVPVAVGFIKNGAYSLNQSVSYRGIPPGTYPVYVQSWIEEPGFRRPDGSLSPGITRIPQKYQSKDKSGFTADIGKSGGTFDFVLEGKP